MASTGETRVTLDLVKRCLEYRADGSLVWIGKSSASSPVTIGSEAGGTLRGGNKLYKAVKLRGEKLLVHRIVWALHNGCWPSDVIDHIDGDETNNRIENLRAATRSQNNMNRRNRSDNKSGLKGARFRLSRRGEPLWISTICVDGKQKYLGRFKTPEDAHAAYNKAANENFGEFARAA